MLVPNAIFASTARSAHSSHTTDLELSGMKAVVLIAPIAANVSSSGLRCEAVNS